MEINKILIKKFFKKKNDDVEKYLDFLLKGYKPKKKHWWNKKE